MPWWYSQDEERYQGPCGTREEAIEIGRDAWGGEAFSVIEAEQDVIDFTFTDRHLTQWMETLEDDQSEKGDPESDVGLLHNLTNEQAERLRLDINDAISAWLQEEKIDTRAWSFKRSGDPERIPEVPLPEGMES